MNDADNSKHITSFDFTNAGDREKIKDWLVHIIFKVEDASCFDVKNQEKLLELLNKLDRDEEYKVPRGRGHGGYKHESWRELVSWYVIKTAHEQKCNFTKAKEITSDRFALGVKTVDSYYTQHHKKIKFRVSKHGFEHVEKQYQEHLNLIADKGYKLKDQPK